MRDCMRAYAAAVGGPGLVTSDVEFVWLVTDITHLVMCYGNDVQVRIDRRERYWRL